MYDYCIWRTLCLSPIPPENAAYVGSKIGVRRWTLRVSQEFLKNDGTQSLQNFDGGREIVRYCKQASSSPVEWLLREAKTQVSFVRVGFIPPLHKSAKLIQRRRPFPPSILIHRCVIFYSYSSSILSEFDCVIEDQAFSASNDLASPFPTPPSSPASKLERRHTVRLKKRDNLLTEEEGGAILYESEKPWSSISHSIPSAMDQSVLWEFGLSSYAALLKFFFSWTY